MEVDELELAPFSGRDSHALHELANAIAIDMREYTLTSSTIRFCPRAARFLTVFVRIPWSQFKTPNPHFTNKTVTPSRCSSLRSIMIVRRNLATQEERIKRDVNPAVMDLGPCCISRGFERGTMSLEIARV